MGSGVATRGRKMIRFGRSCTSRVDPFTLRPMSTDAHGRPTGTPLAFTPDDVRSPSHAERARTLVSRERTAALGTLAVTPEGHPYVSYVTFAIDEGRPVLCLSRIAEHGKNLAADPRVSLLVHEAGKADPLANGRVTLLGRAVPVADRDRARAAFIEANAHAAYYVDYQDFAFHALEVESLRYIGGYGRMSWVSAEDWYGAAPDPLAASAKGMIDHMNDDHADALVLYAKAFTSAHDATEVTMTAIDRYGFEMTVTTPRGRGPARLAFEQELATPKDARVALVALVGEARKKLSGG